MKPDRDESPDLSWGAWLEVLGLFLGFLFLLWLGGLAA